MKKLAVIMSIYKNDRRIYVQQAIESILSQTYGDFDFYIQYDGPVADEVRGYIALLDDERIKVQSREENKGLAQSLNDLLAIVIPRGYEYIARMDADDISMPDRFEKQINYLDSNKSIDCVGGAISEIDENGESRNKTTYYPCTPTDIFAFFKKRNPVAHPTAVFRKSYFEKIGRFYSQEFERNEDTMLWYDGLKAGLKIANLPYVVLKYRITDAMFTQRRNGRDFAKSQLQMRKMINNGLNYGFTANLYAYAMYLLMISPTWLKKWAYKVLR